MGTNLGGKTKLKQKSSPQFISHKVQKNSFYSNKNGGIFQL